MSANPFDLDTSFSGDGKVITDFGGGADDVAQAVAVQADGKIVVAGQTQVTVNGVKKVAFAAVRYNSDGSLDDGSASDTTKGDKFGLGGKFVRVLDLGSGSGAVAIALQSDGKIVLAGNSTKTVNQAAAPEIYFLRLNKDGTIDGSYGSGGVLSTSFPANVAIKVNAVAIEPDNSLLAGGTVEGEFNIMHITNRGQIDTTFGGSTNGVRGLDFGGLQEITGVALDNLGRIVISGNIRGNTAIGVARLLPDGSDDKDFGTNGRSTFQDLNGISSNARSLAIVPSGEVYVGYAIELANHTHAAAAVVFDAQGKFLSIGQNPGKTSATGLVETANGLHFLGGTTIEAGPPEDFYIAGINIEAETDVGFGSKTDHSVAMAMTIGPRGRIVQVGYTTAGGGGRNFAIARYVGTPINTVGAITGNYFLDSDGDGVRDGNEIGLGSRRVFADLNNNGIFDPFKEPSVLTDVNGNYKLFVAPGTYSVREVPPNEGTPTLPLGTPGLYTLTVKAGQMIGGIDFGNAPTTPPPPGARITGSVFFDFNGSGSRDVQHPTEPDLPGRTVFIDLNDNGVLDADELQTTTDGGGNYAFNNLAPGSYRVRDVLPDGWANTNPTGGFFDVTVPANQTIVRSFGTTFADPDDAITEVDHRAGNQIKVGGAVNFTIGNVTDVDLVRFTVTAGQRVSFDVDRASGSGLNSFLRLFDAVGIQLASNDDAAAPGETKGADSFLAFTFKTAGTYYIGVSNNANRAYDAFNGANDNDAGSTGAYKLSLVNMPVTAAAVAGPFSQVVVSSPSSDGHRREGADRSLAETLLG